MDILGGGNDARSDGVALHDAAEDVDQDALDLGILEHDLEGFGDLLGAGAAADVEEVGRFGAEQLDRVHGRHRQTGAIDQTADIAVQGNVGKIELRGFDLGRVFLVKIAHGDDVRMTEQGVGIEIELAVEGNDGARPGDDQRIDFGQAGIGLPECLVQTLEDDPRLRHRSLGHADFPGNVVGFRVFQTRFRIDEHLVNFLRRMRGDFLDVHAALGRCHQADPLTDPIDDHAEIEFLLDVGALLDQQAADLLTLRAGLMGLQLHAEYRLGVLPDFVGGLRHLDATALAAPAGMDLCLDHPNLAAESSCGGDRLIYREAGKATRGGHAILPQDFLALVLMDFHASSLLFEKSNGEVAESAVSNSVSAALYQRG